MRWTSLTLIATGAFFVIGIVLLIVRGTVGYDLIFLGPLTGTAWILTALMLHWHATGRMIEVHVLRLLNRANLVLAGVTALLWISVLWLSGAILPVRGGVILVATPLTVITCWFLLSSVFCVLKVRHSLVAGLRLLTIILLTIGAVYLAVVIPYGLVRVPGMGFAEEQRFFRVQARLGTPIIVFGSIAAMLTLGAHGFTRLRARERGDLPKENFRAVCPRCGGSRVMQTEGDQCPNCGLMIKLQLP